MTYGLLFSILSMFANNGSILTEPSPEEIKILLERHNYWRSEVGLKPLVWSQALVKSSNDWAQKLKKEDCGFFHSKSNFGENLWTGTTGAYPVANVVDDWASEKVDYNYEKNNCNPGKVCGHYTQIVWENTTEVGCAKIECDGMTTWVCQYNPPGNYVGQKPY